MSLEVTKQELLKQAIYLKKLYETTRVQDYKDQETRIRRIVVELDALTIGTSNVATLDDLTDVTISAPANAQVLTYNSTTLQWENQTPAAGGGGDMLKSTYDVDNDGVVDSAETTQIIVRNSTGPTLLKGQVVYLSGATGNRPNAVLSRADTEVTATKTIGIVVANISNNSDGYVAVSGTLHNLDTSAFADGVAVWLSATTAGAMTSTIPAEPNHTVFIGYIARAHPNQGRLVIVIQNGYELNELHGVLISSEANNDLLVYESSTGLWKNSAISSILPNGLLRLGSAISTTLQTVTDYLSNVSVLQLNSRRIGILSDSSVTTQTSSVIQATTTNANLVIAPNGNGSIVARIPDGTAVGGNARGDNSVDLQIYQSTTGVESGAVSVCGGGRANTASNNYSVVSGGYANTSSGQFSYVGAGTSNNATSNYSTVSGGQSNTASTNTHATVVGGQSNTSSGQYSVSGGNGSVASGNFSFAFNGSASAVRSIAIGSSCSSNQDSAVSIGYQNTATGKYSNAFGVGAQAYLQGMQTYSSIGGFVGNGEAQSSVLVPIKSATLTTAATTVLSLDGTGTTNLIIPNGNNRAWNVQIDTIAVVTAITGTATGVSVGDTYQEKTTLSFKRIGGASSLVALGSRQQVYDTSMATAIINFSAGASQQLQIQFQAPAFAGGGSITCRVVSKVSLVEVAY